MQKTTPKILPVVLAAILIAPTAFADHKGQYAYARVIDAEPITQIVRIRAPRQECWNEQVTHYEEPRARSATPMIAGALIGGLIGNELGHHKTAKKAGVAAGAILGGSIGRDLGNRHAGPGQQYYSTEEVCRTIDDYHEEERIIGYHVSYKYHGSLYHTRTTHHPGDRIKVKVSVMPAHYY